LKNTDVTVHCDEEEWSSWQQRGDPVLHIELGKWADLILIAPLDANTLAKIAQVYEHLPAYASKTEKCDYCITSFVFQGFCDNLLTCVVRAWDLKKPLIFCPAMNTRMWTHPITAVHIEQLKSWGFIEIPCISKTLMCKDVGMGAMAEPETIVEVVKHYML
jgi:phosphopantothenoylcysteine decarboxylase